MVKFSLTVLIVALSLAFIVASVNAAEQMAGGLGRAFGANEIIGIYVENHSGERLGKITDLVADSEGRIALVILSHGGFWGIHEKETAIPFGALRYDQAAKQVVLDISKEELAAAPTFKMSDLSDQKLAESVYRYFGQQPYWSEGEALFKGADEPLEEVRTVQPPLPYVSP
jgi:sporulation protein YlmC with PRC-barrel domain